MSDQREWNDYHVSGYSYFHSVINLWWCVGVFYQDVLECVYAGDWTQGVDLMEPKG